jgi:hypothetical protein
MSQKKTSSGIVHRLNAMSGHVGSSQLKKRNQKPPDRLGMFKP